MFAAGGADVDDVELLALEQFGFIRVNGDAGEFARGESSVGSLGLFIAHGDELDVVNLAGADEADVPFANGSGAYDCGSPFTGHRSSKEVYKS
jgi:hypothetical protein